MDGLLSEHPLAELISEILEKKMTGALRVKRQRARAVVYLRGGELLYAAANLRALRLIKYLKKHGLPADVPLNPGSSSDFDLAGNLVKQGLLTQNAVDAILVEQVSDVLRVLLLWTEGEWSFDERARPTASLRAQIPIRQLFLDAARRIDLEFIEGRFRNPGELISAAKSLPDDLRLSASEGFLVSRVEDPIALAELLSVSAFPESAARRIIYGLTLAGVLERENWFQAFRGWRAEKSAAPQKAPEPAAEGLAPDAGQLPERDAEEEVTEFLEQLARAKSHYEVLNVPTTAAAGDLKLAYYSLARRFHPDRFHELARTPLHRHLEAAFARITQAYEILANADSRAAYDVKLAALTQAGKLFPGSESAMQPTGTGNGGSISDNALAEQRFREGAAALQLGQINAAIACFAAAARLAPDQAQNRAYYGRALGSQPESRRLAETELQAAVRLDPNNATYRVMLAELYRDLGFPRRAIAEVERALSLDGKNSQARSLLENLKSGKR